MGVNMMSDEYFYDGIVKIKVRDIVKEEIRDVSKQMKDKPYAEPEPTYRFDRMTASERYYVAVQLGL